MKKFIRSFLINLVAVAVTTHFFSALSVENGIKGLLLASFIFMIANFLLTPFLKIILLPLNLLTLGIFAWLANVLTLYILVTLVPIFKLQSFFFSGWNINGFIIPASMLTTFQVAIISALVIALIIHLLHWLVE